MRIKRWLKPLLKLGATTVVAGLNEAGPLGAVVGSVVAKTLGIDPNSEDFERRVANAAKTREGRRLIMLAELELQNNKNNLLSKRQSEELKASVEFYRQAQQSYRTELKTGDKFISHTRPLIVRRLFILACVMVASLIVSSFADMLTSSILIDRCFGLEQMQSNEKFTTCLSFVDTRNSYLSQLTNAYADNWQWLSLLFGILVAFFGGRTWEKRHLIETKDL